MQESTCPNLIAALTKKISPRRQAILDFYAMCPNFCDASSNWNILTAYLPPEFDDELRWPTTDELVLAYDLARKAGHFRVN